MSETEPVIGHNVPPFPTPIEIVGRLNSETQSLADRVIALREGVDRFLEQYKEIPDDEALALAAELVKAIQGCEKIRKDRFEQEKAPFLKGGQAVDQFFNTFKSRLIAAHNLLSVPMNAYQNAKDARIRAERQAAAQKAAEEAAQARRAAALEKNNAEAAMQTAIAAAEMAESAARAAAAPSADITRVRSHGGAVTSVRTYWDVECLDMNAVPRKYLMFNQKLAEDDVRRNGVRKIEGCKVTERKENVVR